MGDRMVILKIFCKSEVNREGGEGGIECENNKMRINKSIKEKSKFCWF